MTAHVLPLPIVYAGLIGCLLSLIIATYQQNWSLRVFFLLALRLAIGWHFAFEGLHKINSHWKWAENAGDKTVDKDKQPFSSEPYFLAAEGPFGDFMRKRYLGDPGATIAAKLTPAEQVAPEAFAKLGTAEQAAKCPPAAAAELDKAIPDAGKQAEAKAAFARWVYGVDARDAKVKFVGSGDVAQTAPDRLKHIAVMKKWVAELKERDAMGLGAGYGVELKRAAEARKDVRTAETDLANDADDFIAKLVKLYGGEVPKPAEKPIVAQDKLTMWTLTIAGFCVFFGLFTPVACLVCAGFLVLTYLTHPAFPWHPLPPNTEGNPLFINKNVIECLALLTIAVHPTGRWLGLDAIWTRLAFGK